MRDYEELVKRLKESDDNCHAECYECPCECLSSGCNIFSEAADAIEELIKTSRRWELEAAANENDKQYLVDENRRLVDSLMNLLVPKWIPVTERLPHYLDHVLCVNKYGIQMVGYLTDYKESGFRCESGMDSCDYITHWMPLPDPPKEVLPNGEV